MCYKSFHHKKKISIVKTIFLPVISWLSAGPVYCGNDLKPIRNEWVNVKANKRMNERMIKWVCYHQIAEQPSRYQYSRTLHMNRGKPIHSVLLVCHFQVDSMSWKTSLYNKSWQYQSPFPYIRCRRGEYSRCPKFQLESLLWEIR